MVLVGCHLPLPVGVGRCWLGLVVVRVVCDVCVVCVCVLCDLCGHGMCVVCVLGVAVRAHGCDSVALVWSGRPVGWCACCC